ncbi:hypothetical protein ATO12_07735 [Aquimarina atlantica]|uniref:Uncharacterized protein n=1 Tax=Aquimarina atlantica TaxID=1317122 RepID=A0A023BN07_9FLAO|nr:hypothetical protein [Aquimarina atlantica]EZH71386.1 hypothetical protein ATO12_07735 [Aquimarina atlantica]
MKTNKKVKLELKKINVTKLTDSNIARIKGGNKDDLIRVDDTDGSLISRIINGANHSCNR